MLKANLLDRERLNRIAWGLSSKLGAYLKKHYPDYQEIVITDIGARYIKVVPVIRDPTSVFPIVHYLDRYRKLLQAGIITTMPTPILSVKLLVYKGSKYNEAIRFNFHTKEEFMSTCDFWLRHKPYPRRYKLAVRDYVQSTK